MTKEQTANILSRFPDKKVVVFGDLMLDEYHWGRATRISPESPVMVVDIERESSVPGGAANVVNNLVALGAQVLVIGVVGDDNAGHILKEALKAEGADISGIVTDPSRPTTRKTRIVAHSQQVLRIDREQTYPVTNEIASKLLDRIHSELLGADAIVISDYNKGVLTNATASVAVKIAREAGLLLTANPKPQTVHFLQGAPFVQLNQIETESAAALLGILVPRNGGDTFSEEVGEQLRSRLELHNLLVTRGSKGLTLFSKDHAPQHIPPHVVEVFDVAGAGDTVISTMTLGLICGANAYDSAVIANRAAACVVRKVGVATVTVNEILSDWIV